MPTTNYDASQYTKKVNSQAVFADYISKQKRIEQGCANRATISGGNRFSRAASVGTVLVEGEFFTTTSGQSNILTSNSCPIPIPLRALLPTDIASLSLWLDAFDSTSFVLSGTNITSWRDKSGNGFHTSNLTGTATLSNNAVVFTGSQALGTNLSYTTLNSHTMLAIISYSPGFTGAYIETNATTGTAGSGLDYFITGAGQQGVNGWSSAFQMRGATGIPLGASNLHEVTFNSSAGAFMFMDGAQTGSNASAFTFASGGLVSLGNWKNGGSYGDFFTGRIHEILMFSTVLTAFQRQQMEGYMAWKWGLQGSLPANHPFKTAKPQIQV